ncbi:unnamed protein product [Caretta caretta]
MAPAWLSAVIVTIAVLEGTYGADSVTQTEGTVTISQGDPVLLNCTYQFSASAPPYPFWAFYANSFSPDPTDTEARRVLWTKLPTVSAGDRDRLKLPLSLAELSEALRCIPTNKSPGMDGLTMEFYPRVLGHPRPGPCHRLGRVLAKWAPPSLVLALLPKNWDLRDLRNWPPILLLSTDYKVIAKAISLWLGSMLADVVHPDQTYTVPGRTIFDNLYLVRDLWSWGIGMVLYADAECLVRLNWTLTELVSFGRGVRQGCPLSGQLYALAFELFLRLLRWRLTGLALQEPDMRLVLSAFADDVLLVIQDLDDLVRVEACQAVYSAASSAWVNWVKSSGLVVGDGWQASSLSPVLQAIRWSAGPLLYLGVYLSATHPSPQENWQDLEARVGEQLRRWTGLFQCLSL